MRGIADHRLVEVSDLYVDSAFDVGDGAEIANMAIAANPEGGAGRDLDAGRLEPFVEVGGGAAHIAVG